MDNRYGEIRSRMVFSGDTSFGEGKTPSAGHCAVVALTMQALFGGKLISATVDGQSHWYNEIAGVQVDLTGDQFGYPEVQVDKSIYGPSRIRFTSEVNEETWKRYHKFMCRLDLRGKDGIPKTD